MSVFKFFKVFICSFIICFICFSIVDYSRPKEVKALGGEFIPLVAGGTVLGPGAVVLLGVASACGIALCNEDVRNFLSDCGTYCYDELSKVKATYDESLKGIEAELTPSLVEKVIEFAKSKVGTDISTSVTPSFDDKHVYYPYSSIGTVFTGTAITKGSFTLAVNFQDEVSSYYPSISNVSYNIGDTVSFVLRYAHDTNFKPSYPECYMLASLVNGVQTGYAYVYLDKVCNNFTLSIPKDSFDNVVVGSSSFTYPDILKDGCKSIEDYNDKYKEYTGTNSVCADLTKLGGLSLDSSVDDVCTALEGVLPSYAPDVIGTSDIPGISIENDGVNTKVDNPPDTSAKDDTGVLGSILEWLRGLLLDLFKFLEGLLEKLIELLKALLMALFVPSDTFVQDNVDMLKNQLEPKLPYSQYIQLFNDSYEGNQLKDIIINIYGQDVVIVKVTLFERFRELFNMGVYAVMFFLLAVYNYNNIYKLIRGTDYVSATNTINNATGGTGGSGKGGGD